MMEEDSFQLLSAARSAAVEGMVCVGCDVVSSRDAVSMADQVAEVWAAVGLHPHEAQHFDTAWPELCRLAEQPRVVAVGESGLDFYYGHSPEADQVRSFIAHIGLARELDLALVVHVRDAWPTLFEVLTEHGAPERTVLHCFTGGPDELDRALELGCSVSFSGIVSFKNAAAVREAARRCPPDRMLIETDAPYLAPVPHRGSTNQPAYVADVGRALAAARGESESEVARHTTANARRLFGLD